MSENIKKKLEFCAEHFSHEGEFSVLGHTIVIYRTCDWEDYDTGEYHEEYGDVGAFLDEDYFTGWYEADLGRDLRYVMEDVTNELLKVLPDQKFSFAGTFEKDEDLPDEEYSKLILEVLLKWFQEEGISSLPSNLSLSVDLEKETFSGSFIAGKEIVEKTLLLNEDRAYNQYLEISMKIKCSSDELNDYFQQAFDYKIDWM